MPKIRLVVSSLVCTCMVNDDHFLSCYEYRALKQAVPGRKQSSGLAT